MHASNVRFLASLGMTAPLHRLDPFDKTTFPKWLVKKAGRKILNKGEFCPGEPYLFCADPDGYVVEIWYELPTPIDPKPKK